MSRDMTQSRAVVLRLSLVINTVKGTQTVESATGRNQNWVFRRSVSLGGWRRHISLPRLFSTFCAWATHPPASFTLTNTLSMCGGRGLFSLVQFPPPFHQTNCSVISTPPLAEPAWLWDFLRYQIEKRLRAVSPTPSLFKTEKVAFRKFSEC